MQGKYENGVVTLYPTNIEQGKEWAVFLHEAGEHAGLKAMLGDKYAQVVKQFETMLRNNNPFAKRAADRVPSDTPAEHIASERLAYLTEIVTPSQISYEMDAKERSALGAARLLVNRIIAAVKAWAFATLPQWVTQSMTLTPADIQALTVRAARAWADNKTVSQDAVKGNTSESNFSTTDEFEQTAQQYGGQAAWEQAQQSGQTKLDYQQWVQVRTPSFKRWFGEWEDESGTKDQAGAGTRPDQGISRRFAAAITRGRSDVRREWTLDNKTREPLRFYHGTRDVFTAFDVNHPNRKDTGWLGRGVYVTDSRSLASA